MGSGGAGQASLTTAADLELLAERSEDLRQWAEEPPVSLWCAKQDSVRRGIELTRALDDRLAGYRSLAELEPVYAASLVTITLAGQVFPATEVAGRKEQVLALLTAANPLGIELSAEENELRNTEMEQVLIDPMVSCGSSPDGDWEEHGFAVAFDPMALHAAQQFAQLAVFRVDAETVSVVTLIGRGSEDLEAEFGGLRR